MGFPASSRGEAAGTRRPTVGEFGVELARLRVLRGWSVRGLAERTNISEGQICNLQSGRRNPTPAIAAACDTALGAGGTLKALAERTAAKSPISGDVDADTLIACYSRVLDELRGLGRTGGPHLVTAQLRSIVGLLADSAPRADSGRESDVWRLASRYGEYAGWMAQEAGNPAEALRWTDVAVRWAARGGDETMAAYALVRRASIAQHRGDHDAVVTFARAAAEHPAATSRIRIHAARREAQGHAMLHDRQSCRLALEAAHGHRDDDTGTREQPWGPRIENGTPQVVKASCLIDLAAYREAADLFAAELPRLPSAADANSRTRYAVRQATAQAGIGDMDGACRTIAEALPTIQRLDSASVRGELRRFLTAAYGQRAATRHSSLLNAAANAADQRRASRA